MNTVMATPDGKVALVDSDGNQLKIYEFDFINRVWKESCQFIEIFQAIKSNEISQKIKYIAVKTGRRKLIVRRKRAMAMHFGLIEGEG